MYDYHRVSRDFGSFRDNAVAPVSKHIELLREKLSDLVDAMSDIDFDDYLEPNIKYYKPFDYLEDYIDQHHISEKIFSKAGLDRRRKNQLKSADNLKKIDLYRLAFVSGMKKTNLIQFMIVAGHSFSPLSKLDAFIIDYYDGKYGKVDSLYRLTLLAQGKCDVIFSY